MHGSFFCLYYLPTGPGQAGELSRPDRCPQLGLRVPARPPARLRPSLDPRTYVNPSFDWDGIKGCVSAQVAVDVVCLSTARADTVKP